MRARNTSSRSALPALMPRRLRPASQARRAFLRRGRGRRSAGQSDRTRARHRRSDESTETACGRRAATSRSALRHFAASGEGRDRRTAHPPAGSGAASAGPIASSTRLRCPLESWPIATRISGSISRALDDAVASSDRCHRNRPSTYRRTQSHGLRRPRRDRVGQVERRTGSAWTISPPSNGRTPPRHSNSVVLPDPFGPMSRGLLPGGRGTTRRSRP